MVGAGRQRAPRRFGGVLAEICRPEGLRGVWVYGEGEDCSRQEVCSSVIAQKLQVLGY